jgi:glycine/D-amino acid oxidase-like deaminating enzyme
MSRLIRLDHSQQTDVIIVGAGITGSFLAERLTREGREVLVLDRHQPHTASTAASTALLQWEVDVPMLMLENRLGFDWAAAIYRRSFNAVRTIAKLVSFLGEGAHFAARDALYLAGNELDARGLKEEHRLRLSSGLPGFFLDRPALLKEHGFDRDAALLSPGSGEVDPMGLAGLLLDAAIRGGARVASPVTVIDYFSSASGCRVLTSDGLEVEGSVLILANGYEMPKFVPATMHEIKSTWALATMPQPSNALWPGKSLVWEASRPYAYMRSTANNRIIIGGEDEVQADATARDALTPRKVEALVRKLGDLLPGIVPEIATAWAGFFGETKDGLPLIGPVPGWHHCYAAFGYGGNGITFSAMAADLIARLLAGYTDPLLDVLAVDR